MATVNGVDSSSGDGHPVQYDCVDDDRFDSLNTDNLYSDLIDINASSAQSFKNSRYCAIHINIHSLPSKHSELCNMLDQLNENGIIVHFVLLCETFLTDINAHMFPIPGYNFVRSVLSKGGVAIYIANEFNFKERPDLSLNIEGQFESITIEVDSKQYKQNLILSEIYRVPNTNERLSIERFDQMVTSMSNTNNDILIGTDQNFDYLKVGSNKNTSDLLNIFFQAGVLPTIKRPTRITHTSSTIIDNIYMRCHGYDNIDSRIIVSSISDHFPIISCMGRAKPSCDKTPLVFTYRPTNTTKINNLSNALNTTNWDNLFLNKGVSESYDCFIVMFNKLLDENIPMKKSSIPQKSIIRESWMTPGLIKASRKRDILYRKTLGKVKNSPAYTNFIKYRNTYCMAKRTARHSYYTDLLNKYQSDIRKTWQVLNNVTGRSRDKAVASDTFIINGERINDRSIISNEFCTYFSNIGKTFAEAIPPSQRTAQSYMGNATNQSSMFLTPSSADEISKIIKSFKPKKSTGDDGISMHLLKQLGQSCNGPIATIVNMSLEHGIVPDAMKLARVIPIFKAKSKEMFNNYRPISLLSTISKILEKVVHKRLYSFMTKCNILYDRQYGFRPKRSTTDAIVEFMSDVLPSLDNKGSCLSVFLDLSKAFDTINHSILLNKLEHYGVRGLALGWFRSYLEQRRQYVNYRDVQSTTQSLEYGVPQGSVLGPLLFILYTNDLPNALQYTKSILFADDTTMYLDSVDSPTMYQHVNSDLGVLNDWFRANQLSVNPSKTKYLLFSTRGKYIVANNDLFIDNEKLERVKTTVGCIIDQHLSWEYHVEHSRKMLSKGLYAINMSKHILSQDHLKIIYYSLIHPYLLYGIVLWGNTYQKHIHKLEVAQKKAIRSICGAKYNDSSTVLFKKLGILKLRDMYKAQTLMLMYRFINKTLPSPLVDMFNLHGGTHTYDTRHSTDPKPPKVNTEVMRRSFLYIGPCEWMILDAVVKGSSSKSIFKKKIMQSLLSKY